MCLKGGGSSYELGVSKNQWSLRKSRIHWHAMYKYARTYMYLSVLPPSQDVYDRPLRCDPAACCDHRFSAPPGQTAKITQERHTRQFLTIRPKALDQKHCESTFETHMQPPREPNTP